MTKSFTPVRRGDSVIILVLFCLFAVLALILVVATIGLYQRTAAASTGDYQVRTAMNYMANKVRRAPPDSVEATSVNGRQVLLLQESEEYATLIYWEEGSLRELIHPTKNDLPLWSAGTVIVALKDFSVFREGDLLCLTCTTGQNETALLKLALSPGGAS